MMLTGSVKDSKDCSGKDKALLLNGDSAASVHHGMKRTKLNGLLHCLLVFY